MEFEEYLKKVLEAEREAIQMEDEAKVANLIAKGINPWKVLTPEPESESEPEPEELEVELERIKDMENALVLGDIDMDGIMTHVEWTDYLLSRGFIQEDIDLAFEKYDINNDGIIDEEEQDSMLKEMEEKKRALHDALEIAEALKREDDEARNAEGEDIGIEVNQKPLEEWTKETLADYLRAMDLANLAETFFENWIDGDALKELSDEDVSELVTGLPLGMKVKVRKLVAEVRKGNTPKWPKQEFNDAELKNDQLKDQGNEIVFEFDVNGIIICGSCDEQEIAIFKCLTCPDCLCSDCEAIHRRMKATKKHIIEAIVI